MKFYTCQNDKCFKCVFLNPENTDLLNLIIKETTKGYYNIINQSNIEKNVNMAIRRKYLDALLDSKEAIIGIEVNGFNKKYVHPRNTSFICDSYSNYTLVKHEYTEDKMIIQINYTYGIKNDNRAIRKYMIRDNNKTFVKNFIIYEVNMDYCLSFWYNKNKQEVNTYYIKKYRYYIMMALNLEELKGLIEITHDEGIVKYMEELKKVNSTNEFREYITEEQDREFILNSIRKEGIEQGISQGIEQGIVQGKIEGIIENKIEIARNSLKQNLGVDTISAITGLSIREINSIKL